MTGGLYKEFDPAIADITLREGELRKRPGYRRIGI